MRNGIKLLIISLLAIAPSLSFAGGKKKAQEKENPSCSVTLDNKEGNDQTSESKAGLAPKVDPQVVEAYHKFILKNFRFPSAAEKKAMGASEIPDKFVFGSWGLHWLYALGSLNPIDPPKVEDSIFDRNQIEEIVSAYYKKLKSWVTEHNTFPPTQLEFAEYLGAKDQLNLFKRTFNRDYGLFRDYYVGFKENASQWRDMGKFLSEYVDTTLFNDEIKAVMIDDIKKSPALLIAGYVSGQPIPNGIVDAAYTLQKAYAKELDGTVPLITVPAYGLPGGIPERMSDPERHRFICPQTIVLADVLNNGLSINELAIPNRALIPSTGVAKVLHPGKTVILVHPQSEFKPFASNSPYPSASVTTGSINKQGYNESTRAIGARISGIQNELHSTSILIVEKITGPAEEKDFNLESRYRVRSIPFLDKEITVNIDGETVTYPKGFADLNKLYGVDGKVYDLPILTVVFGDSHAPFQDSGYFENFVRQFVDPVTGLKRTDGKPADIFSFVLNDHFDNAIGSRHTEESLTDKQKLAKDPLQNNLNLHFKHGIEIQKDLQALMQQTRGYVPHVYYMESNHDIDRIARLFKTGGYVNDPVNAAVYAKMKVYQDQGKNPLEEYLRNDIGVGFNDHVHFLKPGDSLAISNANITHGHRGGVYGKPVSAVNRRAAVGSGIYGDSHVAMWLNGIYNSGHATLPFDYAKGWYNQGFKALTIRTPIHTQVLFYMDGSFFNPETHGNPNFEFRPGFPSVYPLPVETHKLPATANKIDQYF